MTLSRTKMEALEKLADQLHNFSTKLIKTKKVLPAKSYDNDIKKFQRKISFLQHYKDIPLPPIVIHKKNETISDMVNRYYDWCIEALTVYRDKALATEKANYEAMTIQQRLDNLAKKIAEPLTKAVMKMSPDSVKQYWNEWYSEADRIIIKAKKQGISLLPIPMGDDMELNRDKLLSWCRQDISGKKKPLYKKAWPYVIGGLSFLVLLTTLWLNIDKIKEQFSPKKAQTTSPVEKQLPLTPQQSETAKIFAYVSPDGKILRSNNFRWKITKAKNREGNIVYVINGRQGDTTAISVLPDNSMSEYKVSNGYDGMVITFTCAEEKISNFRIEVKY